MQFNEKLYELRTQHNLTQEMLAKRLEITTQEVYAWEKGECLPEAERLVSLSDLFGVSLDHLLRDEVPKKSSPEETKESAYAVSKEMIDTFLINQRAWLKRFCIGVSILILSAIPFLEAQGQDLKAISLMVMVLIGAFFTLTGVLSAEEIYKKLEKRPLLFEATYLLELKKEAKQVVRHTIPLFLLSLMTLLISGFMLSLQFKGFEKDFSEGLPIYMEICILMLALSAPFMFYNGILIGTYKILVHNEESLHSLCFKYIRRTRRKVTTWLNH